MTHGTADTPADRSPAASFADRHLGPRAEDVPAMLGTLGVESLDELIDQAVPRSIRSDKALELPAALSETAAITRLRQLAGRNTVVTPLIGLGYHGTHTPAVIRRNVLEDPAWYTAYTPYQPEISQGRLEALLNFQTMVARPRRPRPRKRLDARRGHRRSGGHDAVPALVPP